MCHIAPIQDLQLCAQTHCNWSSENIPHVLLLQLRLVRITEKKERNAINNHKSSEYLLEHSQLVKMVF